MNPLAASKVRDQMRRRLKQINLCHCASCVFATMEVMCRNSGIYIVVDTGKELQRRLEEPHPPVDLKQWVKTRKKK